MNGSFSWSNFFRDLFRIHLPLVRESVVLAAAAAGAPLVLAQQVLLILTRRLGLTNCSSYLQLHQPTVGNFGRGIHDFSNIYIGKIYI